MIKDPIKKASEVKVDSAFQLRTSDIVALIEGSNGVPEMVINSFRLGYLQGTKAEKKARKQKNNGDRI